MSNYIKGVQVGNEVRKYDYYALGNKPNLLQVDTTLTTSGKAADAKTVGDKFAEVARSVSSVNTSLNATNENLRNTNDSVNANTEKLNAVNNTFANTLKGTAVGNVVRVDDVSPVKHNIVVKVRPKNLFDYTKIVATNTYQKLPITVDVGKTYTLSSNIPKSSGAEVYFNGDYTDVNGVWDGQSRTLIAETSEIYVAFQDRGNVQSVLDGTYYIQLEEGDTATEYTPYINPSTTTLTYGEDTYTPNSDGSVDGLISTSPTMEMSVPDGFNIHLEYNQDTNFVIKKLTDAIVALGGTV